MTEDIQNKFDSCYSIENDAEAFNCIRDMVINYKGNCAPRLVLFTQDGCDICATEKSHRQIDIDKGIIQEINISSPEGLALATKNKIEWVPALVALDCQDNIILPSD